MQVLKMEMTSEGSSQKITIGLTDLMWSDTNAGYC